MEFIKVILTSLLSVAALLIIAKIMGNKQVAQLNFFDYISGITVGSIAAELATELEEPLKPLIAIVIYGLVYISLSIVMNKLPRTRKFINGSPTILMNDGKLYRKNMKKAKLDLSEFMLMCREQGYFDINNIQTAIFEYNGKLTILPVSTNRPLTPEDMNLTPKPDFISTELIMDGRIMGDNLKRKGLDETWLKKQLEAQGYHSAKEIYLGICSSDNKLSLFSVN